MRSNNNKIKQELAALKRHFDCSQPAFDISLRDKAAGVDGHIVVWNTAIEGPLQGCAKGGTRIRPGLDLAEVRMLARTMALKNTVAGLPLGGAKSGLNADPNAAGFEAQYRRFLQLSRPHLYENGGPYGGFGFDIGARPEHALWACDELQSKRSFTGKPRSMGGTDYDREGIAGLGVAAAARAVINASEGANSTQGFAVHGVGAMGAALIKYLQAPNWQLQAIGDPRLKGSWRIEAASEPLINALTSQHCQKALNLLHKEAIFISDDPNKVLYQQCDVLLPCALQHAISVENVNALRCRYIVEGANSPVEEAAYPLLQARRIPVVPDFVANAGGVIAAYTEMTACNKDNKVVLAKQATEQRISSNVSRLIETSHTWQCTLREAALLQALRTLSAA